MRPPGTDAKRVLSGDLNWACGRPDFATLLRGRLNPVRRSGSLYW